VKSRASSIAICLAALFLFSVGLTASCRPIASPNPAPAPPASATASPAVSDNGSRPPGQAPAGNAGDATINPLLRAEDYDKAIEDAKAAMSGTETPPESLKEKLADAYIARAWFYKSKRLNPYTLTDLFKAVEVAPDYYRAHYELGRFHNNQWQFSIGLLDLNKAIALKPDFAAAYSERAYSYYKNQKYGLALADANRAIDMDASDTGSFCNRSLIYMATGKPDLALQDANKAIQINPQDGPSYYNRGLVYEGTGEAAPAIADFEKTLELSQDDLLRARATAELQKLRK
jgi:tetratricopeptide (TPR) repeat protein